MTLADFFEFLTGGPAQSSLQDQQADRLRSVTLTPGWLFHVTAVAAKTYGSTA
jgi:hypothetical protein